MPIILSSQDRSTNQQSAPVASIRDGIVFPTTESVLTFGRPRSVAAVEAAMQRDKRMVVLMQKDPRVNDPQPSDLYTIGVLVGIERLLRHNGDINTLVKGLARVQVSSFLQFDPYIVSRFEVLVDQVPAGESTDTEALMRHLTNELKQAVNLGKNVDFLSFMNIMSGMKPIEFSHQLAAIIDIKGEQKQALLSEVNTKKRLEKLVELLAHEINILDLERNIATKTQAKFDKSIKEAVLRERMKTIEKELGEDTGSKEIRELRAKLRKAQMPEEVEKRALKELQRLAQMSTYNPEASYLRTYLDWLVELPWKSEAVASIALKQAILVLDKEHFGLKKVKERIVEYLAVLKLREKRDAEIKDNKQKTKGQPTILCFVGPPGVGKTSIGRSIAHSLNRKFVKMSLGGIRDEAEIRGHRRTYVGALPGRIIQGIKQAGSKNPVFMLDEIDKVGTDFRGDPSAALLEALDPEQNHSFTDHYLEVPYDLSEVFFITTCNILDTIPPALLDRLEVIHFPGYTEEEKYRISKDYLIIKQLEAHSLTKADVIISDPALKEIIRRYTREAGVRNLERQIAKIFRKVARKKAEAVKKTIVIGRVQLHDFLGPYKFRSPLAEKKDEVGMSTGLFWTQAGGGILFVEVALMPGKGDLKLTGQLGEVMKESAHAALSYVRSRYRELGLPEKFYQHVDIHIHVPEGAVKKDGPSAGIAITTALVSALTNMPVHSNVGMTGEVTLRGRVLEIGGVKEKVIAAHTAGLNKVIMPKDNMKDLEEISKKVTNDVKFVFVENMDEVLSHALRLPQIETKGDEIHITNRIPLFEQLPQAKVELG